MLESDLSNMTIAQLQEFNQNPGRFHQVKHTVAFSVLITRLETTEKRAETAEQHARCVSSKAEDWERNFREIKERIRKVLSESAGK